MRTRNYLATQAKAAQVAIEPDCKTNFTDFIPATEWSVLAIVAVFLVRYITKVNVKLLEEICEDEDT